MMCCLIFRMVRHYRRKGLWKEPTTSQMNEALEAIQNGLSIRKAADQFNLNRECLRRHSIKKKRQTLTISPSRFMMRVVAGESLMTKKKRSWWTIS